MSSPLGPSSRFFGAWVFALLSLLSLLLLESTAVADEINYFYDDAGRLVRAVKGTEGVTYEYDEVGNLLSITRGTTSPNSPTIQSITPDMIFIGSTTPVVITGQNLLSTKSIASDNPALTFKNISATDTAVRADIIVPSGASPGPANITVTTLYGSASIGVTLTFMLSFDPPLLVLMPSSTGVITVSLDTPIGRDLTIVLRSSNPSVVTCPQSVTIPAGGTTSFTVNALSPGLANINSGTPRTDVLVNTESGGPPAGQPITSGADPVSVLINAPPGTSPVASLPVSARIAVSPIPDATATASMSVLIDSPPGNSSVASQPVSAKIEVPPIPDVTAMASVSVFIDPPPGNSAVASQPVSARVDVPSTIAATAAAAVSAAIDFPAGNSIAVSRVVAVRIMSATEKALNVVKTGLGNGTVVSTPTGINCGVNCTQAFTTNTAVTLTATPGANSVFAGWSGGGCSGTGTCTVTMSSDLVITAQFDGPITVTTSSLPWGTVGVAYSQTLAATGGLSPYTWTKPSGNLPDGLTLNSSTGVISGTPTKAGTYNFTVQVQDKNANSSTKALSIVIYDPLSIATASLPAAYIGTAYSQSLTATGGLTPYTWSKTSGNLPAGLTLSGGVISGNPTTTGTSTFTVQVTDSKGTTASRSLSITVYNALSITTSSLPWGTVGVTYSQTLAATGGLSPYTWTITPTSGNLPDGLTLNSSTGVISGTPTKAQTFSFMVQVQDTNGAVATRSLLIVIYNALSITTSSLPAGYVNTAYNQTLAAAGGLTPYTWTQTSGSLPPGLTLSTGGVISGTPTATGTSSFTVQVKDANTTTSTKSLSITVYNRPSITTSSLASGTVGVVYSQTLAATGGLTPYTWSLTSGSSLPAGLNLSNGGVISGTPTTAGTFSFTVQVQDANAATSTKLLSIVIYSALSITTTSLPPGYVGTAYSQTLAATGGLTPYTWSISSGSLPTGLALSSGGLISGTPTTTGTSNFTVKVVDARSVSTTKALSIVINAALPDLIMTAVSGPTSATKGQTVTISYTVKNQGGANAGQFSIGFYLSTDSTITTGDILLKTIAVTSLNSNSQSSSSTTVTIPSGTAAGTYYIGAIADVNGNISETNETNNSKAGNQIVIQ